MKILNILIIISFQFSLISCKPFGKSELTKEEQEFEDALMKPSEYYYVVSRSGLKIREEPSVNSKSIITIPFNNYVEVINVDDEFNIVEGKEGKWFKVSYTDKNKIDYTGYTFSAYLSKQNQIKYFNSNKSRYYTHNFDPVCDVDHNPKCSIVKIYNFDGNLLYEFSDEDGRISWYDNENINIENVDADGGGFVFSQERLNLLNLNIKINYVYSGSFENDSNGYRDLKVNIMDKYLIFELNSIHNSLVIYSSNSKYEKKNKLFDKKSANSEKIELENFNEIVKIDYKKSTQEKNTIYFAFLDQNFQLDI